MSHEKKFKEENFEINSKPRTFYRFGLYVVKELEKKRTKSKFKHRTSEMTSLRYVRTTREQN